MLGINYNLVAMNGKNKKNRLMQANYFTNYLNILFQAKKKTG